MYFGLFKKVYVNELEEVRVELSKNNGKLKDEIECLKKEKKEVENALSIVEVTELRLYLFRTVCMYYKILIFYRQGCLREI